MTNLLITMNCICAWNTKTARCNSEICKDSQKSFIEDIWYDRLDAIFRKDYHFLAIRESNRTVLYITGIFALRRGSPRARQDLPFVSFVPGEGRERPRLVARRRSRKDWREDRPDPPDRSLISRIESRAPRDDWKRWIRRNVLTESRVPLFLALRSTFFCLDGSYEPGKPSSTSRLRHVDVVRP